MNNLHRDILDESASDFRKRIFDETVAVSRRRRVRRSVGKAVSFSALLLVACFVLYPWLRPSDPSRTAAIAVKPPTEVPQGYRVIDSEPFGAIVRTTQLPEKYRMTSVSSIKVLESADHPEIVSISDEQLLGLFEGRSVALISRPDGEELILMGGERRISN